MAMKWCTWLAAAAFGVGCGTTSSERGDGDTGIGSASTPTGIGDDAGDGGADTASASMSGTADGSGGPGDDGAQTKFDVGSPEGEVTCGGGMGDGETHSYIWIANSGQGTVSKINTQSLVEEGRYIVRPDSAGNPSRTSVALSGNVAIANRSGGVVKIYSNLDDCVESNGVAGLQSSSGAADVLPWGTEECVAWYTPFPYATQRPLAWAQGDWNEATCSYVNEKLWTSGGNNAGTADVLLLDGETGVVEDMVTINNVIGWAQLYGGAVDGDGNFWTVDHNWNGPSTLIRVDRMDLAVDKWPVTGQVHYGLAVDSVGRPWLCGSGGASRFDPGPQTWTHLAPLNGGSALGGCMTDGAGTLWTSPYPTASLVAIDTETVSIVNTIPIPEYVHGVSIDFDGNVWGVGFSSSNAYRVDPVTGTFDTVSGLISAYTYSDMTGFALSTAGVPSG
jgi:hypothetical protein